MRRKGEGERGGALCCGEYGRYKAKWERSQGRESRKMPVDRARSIIG